MNIPAEFTLGGIYMPPLLMASIMGAITAMIVARLLNSYRLSKYFFLATTGFCGHGDYFYLDLRYVDYSILK